MRVPQMCAALVGVLCLPAAIMGCSTPDRAGGNTGHATHTLVFAQSGLSTLPELTSWAELVDKLSHGSLRIDFREGWRQGEVSYEQGVIQDVRDGKADLGWVSARAFDRLGYDDFRALLAPFLVDSYSLEQEVFSAGIPDQMAAGLARVGLVTLAVWPGGLRRVLGRRTAFTSAGVFRDRTIGTSDSVLAEQTLEALGAKAVAVANGAGIAKYDGAESTVIAAWENQYADTDHVMTSNVNLWPRATVLIASPESFSSLSDGERTALVEASRQSQPATLDTIRQQETDAVEALCRTDFTFAAASSSELGELVESVQPVYHGLRRQPRTAAWLDEISALKDDLGEPPDALACPDSAKDPPTKAMGIPDGTYTRRLVPSDYTTLGLRAGRFPFGTWTLKFEDGLLTKQSSRKGDVEYYTYDAFHGQVFADGPVNMVATYHYRDGRLWFTDLSFPGCGDCMIDPHRSDYQGGYETSFAGIPKPWVLQP